MTRSEERSRHRHRSDRHRDAKEKQYWLGGSRDSGTQRNLEECIGVLPEGSNPGSTPDPVHTRIDACAIHGTRISPFLIVVFARQPPLNSQWRTNESMGSVRWRCNDTKVARPVRANADTGRPFGIGADDGSARRRPCRRLAVLHVRRRAGAGAALPKKPCVEQRVKARSVRARR